MNSYDLIIVGGGAAGILCALQGKKQGIDNILIIEKDPMLGGMLSSGNYNISENRFITGKQYKEKLMKELNSFNVEIKLNTMVLKIEDDNGVICTSSKNGIEKIQGKQIILCNGGKETSRKVVNMVGDRSSGILTVGMAKKIFNIENIIPGKNILIYGDATLYMIEEELKNSNINVVGIVCNNKNTDKVKCYDLTSNIYEDYEISSIKGEGRISEVTLSKDGNNLEVECDTLIFAQPMLSDGVVAMRSNIILNPETTGAKVNQNYMTSRENIYACGNGIFIHNSIEEIEKECISLINNLK